MIKNTYNKRLGLILIYVPLLYHGSLNKYRYLDIHVGSPIHINQTNKYFQILSQCKSH